MDYGNGSYDSTLLLPTSKILNDFTEKVLSQSDSNGDKIHYDWFNRDKTKEEEAAVNGQRVKNLDFDPHGKISDGGCWSAEDEARRLISSTDSEPFTLGFLWLAILPALVVLYFLSRRFGFKASMPRPEPVELQEVVSHHFLRESAD